MSLPKVPGLISDYDPTRVDHKKISHTHLEKIQNTKNKDVPLYALPKPPPMQPTHVKEPASLSYSQTVHSGFGHKTAQLYEPVFTQLDKQVGATGSNTPVPGRCGWWSPCPPHPPCGHCQRGRGA